MIVDLAAMGVLGQENRAALAIYCQNWARWVTAEDHINTHGVIVAAPRTGAPMQNPNVVIANNAADRLIRIAAEFGLTPSSRQRVGIASKQTSEVSAWDMLQVIDGGKSG